MHNQDGVVPHNKDFQVPFWDILVLQPEVPMERQPDGTFLPVRLM